MGTGKGERDGRGKGDTREKIGDCYILPPLRPDSVLRGRRDRKRSGKEKKWKRKGKRKTKE
jgi:hypothetical protein